MPFTYDPTTARGRVRLLVADTNTDDATKQIFTDAEIDAFLSLEDNEVFSAAAAACEAIAADRGKANIAIGATGMFSLDLKGIASNFRDLASRYRKRATEGATQAEEIDQLAYEIGPFGGDHSEYVGDTF